MSRTLSGKTVMVLVGSGPYGVAATRAFGREGANVALERMRSAQSWYVSLCDILLQTS
jgi:NAD(P)-dependent dehydrogenase (short-subunit alcohol dehydrogenase family)